MNGAHDLGGMHGFEAINTDPNDPLFHAEWERRTLALTLACGFLGKWNIDMSRFAREQMPPGAYLESSYYEHWLFGLEKLLLERGLVTQEELAAGRADERVSEGTAVSPERASEILAEGGSCRVDEVIDAKFAVGERVRTRNSHPIGHTRIPRYARGRMGVIEIDHGVFVFPDANAMGEGPAAQHLYSVRFEAGELWGEEASAHDSVSLDLWDDYLEKNVKPLDLSSLASLPLLPRDADGPVFAEPWEAQAFALTLQLHEAGYFTWSEWAECLSAEIKAAQEAGDPDLGDTYYLHWLSALERLAVQKDLVGTDELTRKRQAWTNAALSAEHGKPIHLGES